MSKVLFWIALLLCVCPAMAGNRADVNADQVVNAADTVLLANIVAGNLDAADYNLETVALVAPQGGDFTNPADAADWVTAQSPGPAHRFVILVTPGEYTVNRTIDLPAYTTLQGYGRRATRILGGSLVEEFALLEASFADQVAVRDLTLCTVDVGDQNYYVVSINQCAGLVLEGLDITTNASQGNCWLMMLQNSSGDCRNLELTDGPGLSEVGIYMYGSQFNFDHCQLKMTNSHNMPIYGLFVEGCMGVIWRDSRISVRNQASGYKATSVAVQFPLSYVVFKACGLEALAVSTVAPADYYFESTDGVTDHTVRFFQCQLDGHATPGGASVVWFGCSTSLGVAVP